MANTKELTEKELVKQLQKITTLVKTKTKEDEQEY